MTDRRYNDEEVAAIFLRAAESPQALPARAPTDEGLSLTELQEIGRDVGIPPEAIARAAQSLTLRAQRPAKTFLGLPISVERAVVLDRRLTDEEWERLVVVLRETFQARGTVRSDGSLRQWTNGNLQALLEPTATGHQLRLRTLHGNARVSIGTGLATVGLSAVVAIASAVAADIQNALPGIAFLFVAGLGLFGSGALRLPKWARLRRSQMEAIAEGLVVPAEHTPSD